jgi:hypothetical protein
MERRGFLKGVFGGLTAGGLIIAAQPEEIAAFTSPLVRDAPLVANIPAPRATSVGQELYNAQGELVAYISQIHVDRGHLETTMWGDAEVRYVSGLPQIRIEAVGVGHLSISDAGPTLRSYHPRRGAR